MKDYRFRLQKYTVGRNNKRCCPQCGRRRCFTPYVDAEGRITFPDYVGICDHVNRCGYHYPPKAYFHDHPEACEKNDHWRENDVCIYRTSTRPQPQKPQPQASFIERTLMEQTLHGYSTNSLFVFLAHKFGEENMLRIFKMYNVGTAKKWGGSPVFWQVDSKGRVHAGKVMAYEKNGHRKKLDGVQSVCWVHSILHLKGFNLEQCLFGEHLLPLHPNAKVMIVESEKTALVMTYAMPDYIWLATGGKSGCFNERACSVLKGRDVMLVPDLKATDDWHKKMDMLEEIGVYARITNLLEGVATKHQRERGLDIADFILEEKKKPFPEILQQMIQKNPALQLLIDKLDLEVVSIEEKNTN